MMAIVHCIIRPAAAAVSPLAGLDKVLLAFGKSTNWQAGRQASNYKINDQKDRIETSEAEAAAAANDCRMTRTNCSSRYSYRQGTPNNQNECTYTAVHLYCDNAEVLGKICLIEFQKSSQKDC